MQTQYITRIGPADQKSVVTLVSHQVQMVERRIAFWRGYDLHVAEVFDGQVVIADQLTPDERRGYDAACRAAADADTSAYLITTA